jgi:ribosomal protein S30
LQNPKYKEIKPEDLKNLNPIVANEKKYLQRVLIQINNEVPESIKTNM